MERENKVTCPWHEYILSVTTILTSTVKLSVTRSVFTVLDKEQLVIDGILYLYTLYTSFETTQSQIFFKNSDIVLQFLFRNIIV